MHFKDGFVSMPFLILLSACLSLSSFLSYKIRIECEMMEELKAVNYQVQHERKILEIIDCLIQCDVPDSMVVEVDQVQVFLQFDEHFCYVTDSICSMRVKVDYDEKILKDVMIEK